MISLIKNRIYKRIYKAINIQKCPLKTLLNVGNIKYANMQKYVEFELTHSIFKNVINISFYDTINFTYLKINLLFYHN